MKVMKYLAALLTTPLLAVATTVAYAQEPTSNNALSITCNKNDIPRVVASRLDGNTDKNITILSFSPENFASPASAMESCETTAIAMQNMYNENTAGYLTGEVYENNSVVCLLQRRGSNCGSFGAQVLFSFNKNIEDPSLTLYNMLGEDFQQLFSIEKTVSRIYTDIEPRKWWELF